ncbi:hypothetical protein ColTof4_08753 [Colletotrichum tofieldiae]|uniref:Uncharacterized protein n=2 Tax=Colletotrichum spaethianum species complex TaxID=2707349 RepID=A0A166TT01_9PEZI|nr:hypothetical protein CT0861_01449 [Colletotrichum tofieldiae]GJC89758.1 hypothetical protein ColLi_12596 [Colletotrichum liriopes]GKT56703.1 hypothetical protein ColTof3_04042 [Colletotrichum tofieldiae]GKT76330.1 hypothetical protein ColTof4_08753 [Colletotrichum tofieldiae]GKT87369.1 hypothetical protein Ct61P_05219 [Colletotrichum tofieldiae]
MQLPSFAATSALVLLALSNTALACDGYLFCHCYNSDGRPNDAATQTVCKRYNAGLTNTIDANAWSDGAKECQYVGIAGEKRGKFWHPFGLGNCDWRVMCGEAGATGSDSSCRDHPPQGPKSYGAGPIIVPHN